jgi:hypothetical protein
VVRGLSISSGISVEAEQAASAVQRVCEGGGGVEGEVGKEAGRLAQAGLVGEDRWGFPRELWDVHDKV